MRLLRLPIIVIFAYTLVLLGCGQKGPLILPDKQTPPKIQTEQSTTQNSAKEKQSVTIDPAEQPSQDPENTNSTDEVNQ